MLVLVKGASFDERSHDLATLAVESFERLGVDYIISTGQLAASVVGGGGIGS